MAGIEKNCRWHFAESLGGQEQGPKEATGETFKKEKYDSLVRESIQNSLDVAVSKEKPVIVTFMFKREASSQFKHFLSIRENIAACVSTYDDENSHKRFDPMLEYIKNLENESIDYLEVKDENTTGMSYEKGNRKCGFYSFVKSVGNSSKTTNTAGGSYGFGKASFYLHSKLNAVVVSTKTADGKCHFEGVSSLCSHEIGGKRFVPVGYYCDNDNEEPVSNAEDIPNIFRRQEIGSSVFVMGLGLDDNGWVEAMRSIRASAIKHFWLAILKGKLIVRIGKNNRYNEISAENIIDGAEKAYTTFDDNKQRGHKNPRPYIDAVAKAGSDAKHLYFEKETEHLGKVCLYLLKSKNGNDYILNMRSPMMLVKHELNHSQYGFYAVFLCEDPKGNEVLRMAENAQHNEWDVNNAHEQDKQRVREALEAKEEFVQECIRSVFVSADAEELTFGGLDDFLSIPSSVDEDEEFNNEFGKPTGKPTDEETSFETTELDDVKIKKRKSENLGDVKVKNKKKKRQTTDEDGDEQPTGYEPEITQKPEQEEEPEETPEENLPENEEEEQQEEKEEKQEESKQDDKGEETNTIPDLTMEEDEESERKQTRVKPLRVSYRTYAQRGEDGETLHKLIIHSNRESERVMIGIISGGESSDERLAIRKSDNGNIAGNQLTNVTIQEGKTEITVWFADDMRHAIKLNVYED